jgi:hypothetical protein
MNAKEKASELIVNYQIKCKSLDYQQAKQCALIAVDEILSIVNNIYYHDANILVPYYEQVKQEIEKL